MDNKNQIIYKYYDENGKLLFSKIRNQSSDGMKSFCYVREENGIKIPNLNGCRKILYRLRELLFGISNGFTIFLVEGEKDVETLLNHSLIATTASGSLEWNQEFTQILKDADVVILYDNDKTGIKRKNLLCKHLYSHVKCLRVVDLPGIEYTESHGQDITDWLAMGNTKAQLLEIVKKTPEYNPTVELATQQQKGALHLISIDELLALELPARKMLLTPFLPTQGLVMIVAKRGVGKTHIALGIAYAVASGDTFLRWTAPIAKKVLYIDGEMPAILMQERLKMITTMMNKKTDSTFLKFITPDLQSRVMPDLATEEGRKMIEEYVQDCDLIIIDNISCLFRSGSENEAESWQQAQEWALDLRRRGKSVLFVHHAGKNGIQRGTSKREDILDAVIILKHPDDYKAEEGARFEIFFDKARHFSGDDARSFQVQLLEENGHWRWEISNDPEEMLLEKIADLKAKGFTINAIMEKTSRTKSQIETLIAKARTRGLLN